MLILALAPMGCVPPAGDSRAQFQPNRFASVQVSRNGPQRPALVRKKGRYRVVEPWTVEIGGEVFHVQRGYASNGITASMKVKASLGDGVDEPETWAAVFHDWLFTQPGITRAKADQLFYDLLIAYRVSPLKARLMYTSVSIYSASKALR